MNKESYILVQHKSTNSLSGLGTGKLTHSNSINTLSPTMISSYSKLQNLRQVTQKPIAPTKIVTKSKLGVKRKNSKDKRVSKYIETKKQAAQKPLSFEATGGGFASAISNSKSDLKIDKAINSSVGAYVIANKRNNSLEDLKTEQNLIPKSSVINMKSDASAIKGHKRSSQDAIQIQMNMNGSMSKWEEGGSTSPDDNNRAKYTKEKLKKITTYLGSGASRNSASKGIMASTGSKGSKKGKYKSPKYMTQGAGSYYLKGKNSSVLST